MWGAGCGYWMPKLRVVESRIFDGIAEFERGVERFCKVGSSGFGLLARSFEKLSRSQQPMRYLIYQI